MIPRQKKVVVFFCVHILHAYACHAISSNEKDKEGRPPKTKQYFSFVGELN